jgi:iron complex outermembrane receptor protein
VHAADTDDQVLEEVIVTGTSIKRAQAEGALPVQVFEEEDIQRTGVTSVTDFVQQLPAMQNVTPETDSVGGTGGGITTASLHDVGEQYTLVLLNGHRLPPSDSGTTIDLNTIPLTAIQRIDVLTDGASAVYGADAIAGVVNFVMKNGESPLTVTARAGIPEHKGGREYNGSISKGFGDLQTDGYAAFLTYSYDKTNKLKAAWRDFASTGIITGYHSGYYVDFFNSSSRSVPPNVDIRATNPDGPGTVAIGSINPYLLNNGECPPAHLANGNECLFDYTSSVEIAPAVERHSFFGSGQYKLGENWTASLDAAYVKADVNAAIAPYPAEFLMDRAHPLFQQYLEPYVNQVVTDYNTDVDQQNADNAADPEWVPLNHVAAGDVLNGNLKYRLYDMGGRSYDYSTDTMHAVLGLNGSVGSWDTSGALTISNQRQNEIYTGGFPLADAFSDALDAGAFDPFPYARGEMPADQLDALLATQYLGSYDKIHTDMLGAEVNAQRSLFALAGGDFIASFGADYRDTGYKKIPNPAVSNAEILFDDPQPSFDLSRKNWGAYGEVYAPITDMVELTGALRYDSTTGVTDSDSDTKFGGSESQVTYKIGAKWTPLPTFAVRASYGTGFRVATMREIAQPQVDFGVTGGTYDCPFSLSYDPLGFIANGDVCVDGLQFEEFQSGNPDLKPEKSHQWNAGFIWSPNQNFSAGINYWSVKVKDAVSSVDETLILTNAPQYLSLFTEKYKSSNGLTYVAIIDAPINIGRLENEGIDWDLQYSSQVGVGMLTGKLAGTHLVKSRYTLPGTSDEWTTSLGKFGPNQKVSFRDVMTASLSYGYGNWEHTLLGRFKSHYTDVPFVADEFTLFTDDTESTPVDGALKVPSYSLFDWRTSWKVNDMVTVVGTIDNLFDKKPPLSLRYTGSHQLGYDPRYADHYLRTFGLNVVMKF